MYNILIKRLIENLAKASSVYDDNLSKDIKISLAIIFYKLINLRKFSVATV